MEIKNCVGVKSSELMSLHGNIISKRLSDSASGLEMSKDDNVSLSLGSFFALFPLLRLDKNID